VGVGWETQRLKRGLKNHPSSEGGKEKKSLSKGRRKKKKEKKKGEQVTLLENEVNHESMRRNFKIAK